MFAGFFKNMNKMKKWLPTTKHDGVYLIRAAKHWHLQKTALLWLPILAQQFIKA